MKAVLLLVVFSVLAMAQKGPPSCTDRWCCIQYCQNGGRCAPADWDVYADEPGGWEYWHQGYTKCVCHGNHPQGPKWCGQECTDVLCTPSPTAGPETDAPSQSPTSSPSRAPTLAPNTPAPTRSPTLAPHTPAPTSDPTRSPTLAPNTPAPTNAP